MRCVQTLGSADDPGQGLQTELLSFRLDLREVLPTDTRGATGNVLYAGAIVFLGLSWRNPEYGSVVYLVPTDTANPEGHLLAFHTGTTDDSGRSDVQKSLPGRRETRQTRRKFQPVSALFTGGGDACPRQRENSGLDGRLLIVWMSVQP